MIEYKSLNMLVYEEIKRRIISNQYKSGEKLDIEKLAEELQVSRTPVTNAVKALERDGYIVILQRSGSYIREYSKEEIEALFDFRSALEEVVVSRAIKDADPKILRRYIGIFKSCLNNLTVNSYVDDLKYSDNMQAEFHAYLWQLCPSIIYKEIQNVIDLTKKITTRHVNFYIKSGKTMEFTENELNIHIQLAHAIVEKDEERAKDLIRKDVLGTKEDILLRFDEINNMDLSL